MKRISRGIKMAGARRKIVYVWVIYMDGHHSLRRSISDRWTRKTAHGSTTDTGNKDKWKGKSVTRILTYIKTRLLFIYWTFLYSTQFTFQQLLWLNSFSIIRPQWICRCLLTELNNAVRLRWNEHLEELWWGVLKRIVHVWVMYMDGHRSLRRSISDRWTRKIYII